VFCVVGHNVRRCLICERLFTRQTAVAHAETACRPSQKSFHYPGETSDEYRRADSENCC
jgi:hypothetical protein